MIKWTDDKSWYREGKKEKKEEESSTAQKKKSRRKQQHRSKSNERNLDEIWEKQKSHLSTNFFLCGGSFASSEKPINDRKSTLFSLPLISRCNKKKAAN